MVSRARRARHILLAEDSEDDILIFRFSMRSAQLEIPFTVLQTTERVINYIEGNGIYADRSLFPVPSLIFLDGQLENGPSTALLSWLRGTEICKTTPIVIL